MPAEAIENTATDPIPDAPTAADDLAAPATSPEPVDDPGGATEDDAALDAVYQSIKSGKGREAAASAYATPAAAPASKAPAPAASDQPAGQEKPGTTPAPTPTAQPAQLTEPQRQLVQRFQLEEADLPADPTRRSAFLSNLQQRHDAQAQMYAELNQLRQGRQSPPPGKDTAQQTTPPPANPASGDPLAAVDKVWKDYFGEDATIAEPMRQALAGAIAPILQQSQAVQQQLATFWQNQEQADQDAGLASIKQMGVEIDRRTTAGQEKWTKLTQAAARLIRAAQQEPGWSPYTYGWKQALSEAAPSVFNAEIQLAQRRANAQAARERFAGTPGPAGRPGATRPQPDEDTALDEIYRTVKNEGREAAARLAAGRR